MIYQHFFSPQKINNRNVQNFFIILIANTVITIAWMGTNQTKNSFPESTFYSILDYGYCRVWKSKVTGIECMQQYDVTIENQKVVQGYRQMLHLRAANQKMVALHYFNYQSNEQICLQSYKASILTERIPYRLSQFCNIPYPQALAILKTCLESFQILHSEYGLFLIKSTMIGINNQKKIKIWHHTDYSSAQPQNPHCKSIYQMIESIILSVERNSDSPSGHPRFAQQLQKYSNKLIGFPQILHLLKSYLRKYSIMEITQLSKLASYLRQAEGWEDIVLPLNRSNRFNRSVNAKFSFRENSEDSLRSSQKTVKQKTNLNIYTHKQVNKILEDTQRQISFKIYRSSEPIHIKASNSIKVYERMRQNKIQPIKINKAQYRIPQKRISFNSVSGNNLQSSISKRIMNSNHENNTTRIMENRNQNERWNGQKSLVSSISFVQSRQIRQNLSIFKNRI